MIFNPELRRNVWLDFTLHRIVLTPIIISILVYTSHLSSGASGRAITSFYLACFFIFLWGIKNASETVIEEINWNTWDFQRQSAISPWSMTFGKLFGSTLFAWYGALICLLFYVTSHYASGNTHSLGRELAIVICGGIFGQAVALLASLQIIPQIRREHTHKTFRYFLLGLFVGVTMTWATLLANDASPSEITWFNFSFARDNFTLVSLFLFTGWTVLGLQRSFSTELQYQNLPLAWIGFNLFAMIYFSGLASFFSDKFNLPNGEATLRDFEVLLQKAPYYVAFFIAQALTYIALFTETLSTVRYKKIFLRIDEENPLEAAEQIPLWSISFVLMIVAGILSIFQLWILSSEMTQTFSPTILLVTSMLFTVRDVLLIHYFNFSANIQRVLGASVIYLFLLYALIPTLLSALHLNHLVVMFVPSWGQHTLLALVSIFVQIAIVGYFCLKHWHLSWAGQK